MANSQMEHSLFVPAQSVLYNSAQDPYESTDLA